jgi:AbrB family looped-hinge helix DNA binding protein
MTMSRVVVSIGASLRRGRDRSRPVACDEYPPLENPHHWCQLICNMTLFEELDMQGRARINQQGRIVIPAECRAAAGLKPGDELLIEATGEGELRLRTPEQAIKAAQAIVARGIPKDRDLVAELIAERRSEAERE